jgi:hypothetical protein
MPGRAEDLPPSRIANHSKGLPIRPAFQARASRGSLCGFRQEAVKCGGF